jgi:hypothetical protein
MRATTGTAEEGAIAGRSSAMAGPADVNELVRQIMELIDAGADDPRLRWSPDRCAVRVILRRVIPGADALSADVDQGVPDQRVAVAILPLGIEGFTAFQSTREQRLVLDRR